MTHISYTCLETNVARLQQRFSDAKPFPHVVIDGFLTEPSLRSLLASIPPPEPSKKSSDYLFAKNKFENPTFARDAQVLGEIREELLSERFARFLSSVYGKPLFVDPKFVGGGIHQGGEGSFLDMHADFSRHPVHKEWLRELNILLYLNEDYKEEYGGHLELEHAETRERGRVSPVLNRLVLMLTKGHTLHGYKPISFPPGRYRTSLAAYAYSIDHDFQARPERSTLWRPEDSGVLKTAFAKVSPALVKVKNSLMGSSTARRAESEPEDEDRGA